MGRNWNDWSDAQKQCITARNGAVLVSAAAGSGKTSVLVERIIRLITDDKIDADRLLVVTFTKAAATEMKQRLSSALSETIASNPENKDLLRQQMLLPRAHISTVHSFCSSLLRENFHQLGISPQFKVAEESDIKLLRNDTLDEVFEAYYAAKDPQFLKLVGLLGNGKNDNGIQKAVLQLYEFIQSHASPEEWLDEQASKYAVSDPVSQTNWGSIMQSYAVQTIRHYATVLERAHQMAMSEEVIAAHYGDGLGADAKHMAELACDVEKAEWDDIYSMINRFSFGKLKQLRGYSDPDFKDLVKGLRDNAKEHLQALSTCFCMTAKECAEDLAALCPLIDTLCRIIKDFMVLFEEKKRAKHWVDFNDLEHLSLRLLWERQEDGTKVRTPLARELSEFYAEVLVDEYQDTNAAQEDLFRAISKEETNLFTVGDVKQSIYGFRQAMPELFIHRQAKYKEKDNSCKGQTITLGNNFRSRKTVTDSVNFVFSQLMNASLGGITYDQDHALIPAASYPDKEGFETDFTIVEFDTDDDSMDKDTAEARVIAKKIREFMETLEISDKGTTRPAKYKDFCVLLRSKSNHAAIYVKELQKQGIPAWTSTSSGFFSAPEVAVALSLLRLVDNPTDDVSLLSVMLSPIGGFTPDDLANIRMNQRKDSLYVAVQRMVRTDKDVDLSERCRQFLEQIDTYRRLSATLPADQLIQRLLVETGLEAGYSARTNSEQRIANLRLLHEYARRFEQGRFRGLSAFVRYINQLEERDMDMAPASILSEQADVVRIISIHHSKGLEYPVVFLAGLGNQFNMESTKGNLLLHASEGMGMMWRDPITCRQHNTLPRLAITQSIRQADRAEELRVLYVAMTRAKEKLCLMMTVKEPENKLKKAASAIADSPILPAGALLTSQSMGEWLMMTALRHPCSGNLRKLVSGVDVPIIDTDSVWNIELVSTPEAEDCLHSRSEVPADEKLITELQNKINYRYSFSALAEVPSKLAASARSHQAMAEDHIAEQRPAFVEKKALSAAERGTAMHNFMEHADFVRARQDTTAEANRLMTLGILSPDQRNSLNLARLSGFFQSDLCNRMLTAKKWWREQHFAVSIEPSFFGYAVQDEETDDRIVVQGIADSVFLENDQLVIVDYKTDKIATAEELCDRYREQLRIYKAALKETLSHDVGECWLYSFSLNKAILCEV